MTPLNEETTKELVSLGAQVREALKKNNPNEADILLQKGWDLIPEPKSESDISISKALASARLMAFSRKPELALKWLDKLESLNVSEIDAEPSFVAGVTYLELGNLERAYEEFSKSNKMSHGRCFAGENKKYLDFYTSFSRKE